MKASGARCIGRAGWTPGVGRRVVAPAGVKDYAGIRELSLTETTPDDHFRAGPDCRVIASRSWRIDRAGRPPSVRCWVVAPAGVKELSAADESTPDDHFRARPDRRVTSSCARRIDRAGRLPGVGRGIVAPAGVDA